MPAITPRLGYLWYLQRLVESGFAGRIMFGSDFADQVESGIQTIVDAPFLSAEQKAGILCGNAAQFPAPFRKRLCAVSRDLASEVLRSVVR